MFVRTYMTLNPVCVTPKDNFPLAMNTIRKNNIRHLPVVEDGKLVGIIVEKDLVSTQPSPARQQPAPAPTWVSKTEHLEVVLTRTRSSYKSIPTTRLRVAQATVTCRARATAIQVRGGTHGPLSGRTRRGGQNRFLL